MRGTNHRHTIHDKGGHGGTDIHIVIAVSIGIAQTIKQVNDAVFTKFRVRDTRRCIQGHQMESWCNGQDAGLVAITPESHTAAGSLARGGIKALAFLRTPHPEHLASRCINRNDVTRVAGSGIKDAFDFQRGRGIVEFR